MTPISMRRALIVSILWFAAADAGAQDAQVLSLQAGKQADRTVFVALIERPQDCAAMTPEPGGDWSWWGPADPLRPLRIVELVSSPAWAAPTYPEFAYPGDAGDTPLQVMDPLVFVGSAPIGTDEFDMTLRYPVGEHGWSSVPVRLDLGSASAMPHGADPNRLALAEAQWFRLKASHEPDTGGFYAFAEQQTRRRAELGPRTVDAAAQRTWDDPTNEQYALASGAIAIQEALQLDRMTTPATEAPEPTIPISDIQPVEIDSHPYDEMRAGAEPADTRLSGLAPADNWFVRFGGVSKLLDLADYGDRWGSSLLRLATATGQDFGVRERLLTQLCLSDAPVIRALGPAVIEEVAFTGSDAYIRLGSDVTALFAVRNRALFAAAMEPFMQQAVAAGATRDTAPIGAMTVERLRTPDRRIWCHRAWITAADGTDVCVYSNSEQGLARIADAAAGRLPALSAAPDYQYIRAKVFPFAAESEDGMVFLSDAFVRRAVSPGVRIAQLRRLQALTSLKIIANSGMLYGWDRGPSRPTMLSLMQDQYLTPSDLIDPTGGSFDLDAETGIASSPFWGTMRFMRPLIEAPVDMATEAERDAYDTFRNQYQSYWQRFIDPVAIRIGVGPTITLETHILPLIDLSQYQEMKDFSGGPPIAIDPARFTPGTLLRMITRIGDGQTRRSILSTLGAFSGTNAASDWLGEWGTFWVEDSPALAAIVRAAYDDRAGSDFLFDVFRARLVAGVHVKNKLSLATFLVGLRAVIDSSAPNTVVFEALDPHQGITVVKVSPDPSGDLARGLEEAEGEAAIEPLAPAIYYATIGDGFYVATQQVSLTGLIDRLAPGAVENGAEAPTDRANVYAFAAPGAAAGVRPVVAAILEAQAMKASIANLAQIELLGRCGLLEGRDQVAAARAYLGYRLVDPDGGAYRYDAASGMAESTHHGRRLTPVTLPAPPPGSSLASLIEELQTISAALRFTEDGLETTVRIDRE
jgi:hypothetical protein